MFFHTNTVAYRKILEMLLKSMTVCDIMWGRAICSRERSGCRKPRWQTTAQPTGESFCFLLRSFCFLLFKGFFFKINKYIFCFCGVFYSVQMANYCSAHWRVLCAWCGETQYICCTVGVLCRRTCSCACAHIAPARGKGSAAWPPARGSTHVSHLSTTIHAGM